MHARILLPSLFAATLLSSAALAERSDNDGRSPARSSVKERVMRESRSPEARERVQSRETQARPRSERAAPARLSEKRGCTTDDGGSCSSGRTRADRTASQTKTTKASAPAMPTRIQTQRGCSTDDGNGCSSSSKSDKTAAVPAASTSSKHVVAKIDRASRLLAEEMMKMRLKIEAERLLDMLNIRTCQRKGTCGEDAY